MSEYSVSVGKNTVTLRQSLSSDSHVVNILGVDIGNRDERIIYLDELVHGPKDKFRGWDVSGAISTVLTERVERDVV